MVAIVLMVSTVLWAWVLFVCAYAAGAVSVVRFRWIRAEPDEWERFVALVDRGRAERAEAAEVNR